jgi:N-alpha-acetyl-L-2,4-diaminobutyrate deacetylase
MPTDNEDLVGNMLCRLLREHDVLLDIHSFRSKGGSFAFTSYLNATMTAEQWR